MKVKTILVSQPEPSSDKSPYKRLKEKLKLTIDFRPFIHVEGASAKEVRQQKIDFNNFDNVVLTSRNAVDNYFRLCKEMRYTVPDSTKYFCLSEAVAYYLQKYVVYRKRKVYVGEGNIKDLENVFKKFEKDRFMFPTSDLLMSVVPDFQKNNTRIAAYGKTTIKAAENAGLEVQIKAPTPESPSMTMALEKYVIKVNKG